MKKTEKQIENCITSELGNMIVEFEEATLTEENIYYYISRILLDAQVNSDIVVNVLENNLFGKAGKEAALNIKITEGW